MAPPNPVRTDAVIPRRGDSAKQVEMSSANTETSRERSCRKNEKLALNGGGGPEGVGKHDGAPTNHTVAGVVNAFLRRNRKENQVSHTGRFTTPPVLAVEAHCRGLWVNCWQDGELTPAEDALMCSCEQAAFEVMRADAFEEARNAMSQRNGFESPNFDRKLRELRGKVLRFRQRLPQPDPTPGAPAGMKKAA